MRKSGEVIASRQSLVTIFPVNTLVNIGSISAHPNGVSYVKNGNMLVSTWQSFTRIIQNFLGTPRLVFFLLLTKILDANDWLSVQVHPDDAYGLEHEGELGKTECWYIIDAEEGAEI